MKPLYRNILLAFIIVAVVSSIIYLEVQKPTQGPTTTAIQTAENESSTISTASSTQNSSTVAITGTSTVSAAAFLASRAAIVKQEAGEFQAAPEITDPSGFINTGPFTLASLIGKKVVLLDFWTYSCINCVRTIPYLNAWYAKYKNAGLVIVGMETPEFQFEHEYNNVLMAVHNLGIQYPVVQDNDMGTWDAYQNLYWPHDFLINIDGYIVHDQIGEGDYNEMEGYIQSALTQRAEALGIPTSTVPTGFVTPSSTIDTTYDDIQSPETYFGADRNSYLGNGPVMTNGTYTLSTPSSVALNTLYLGGTWDFEDQYAENKTANATITYEYDSKYVYFVAASDGAPVTLKILRDGKPLGAAAGSDVASDSTMTIQANRLYNMVADPNGYGEHTLTITVENPGLQGYTFTFG